MTLKPKTRGKRAALLLSSTRPRLHSQVAAARAKPELSQDSSSKKKLKKAPLIRKFHTTLKQLSIARAQDDTSQAHQLETELEGMGGMEAYQAASLRGQRKGGDTSVVLLDWLCEKEQPSSNIGIEKPGLRILEVGALDPLNALGMYVQNHQQPEHEVEDRERRKRKQNDRHGKLQIEHVERIDLHPTQLRVWDRSAIKQEDFMRRPLPAAIEHEGFDVLSLSLVVNFVGHIAGRGEMLKRVPAFLRDTKRIGSSSSREQEPLYPCMFLVLPAPCVTNSRYLDEERLEEMMLALGFKCVRRKMSAKLVYYLWRYGGTKGAARPRSFKKEQLRNGGSMNNFAIVME